MAMAVAISPGILLLLIIFENSLAQQCMNSAAYQNSAVASQPYQKSNCRSNQFTQNGVNPNLPQAYTQQVNFQQQSNIQQASVPQQVNGAPQINLQQSNSQQAANLITNSPPQKQQNQDLANIFSALYNIKQSALNQRSNNARTNQQQISYDQRQVVNQNQPNPVVTVVTSPTGNQQNNQATFNPYSESQFQQYTAAGPGNNVPLQQNQQIFTLPVHKVDINNQGQSFSVQNQPLPSSATNQQAAGMQSSFSMMQNSQSSGIQAQPIVLNLQPSQMPSNPKPTSQNQNLVYSFQTQPPTDNNPNQLEVSNQQPAMMNSNTGFMGKQPLMSYMMSQIQNPQGSGNMLSSLLPAMLNSRADKSSSMKAILPLILSLLNDRKGCCTCPHCGCTNSNNQNNDLKMAEPIINTGYSNQINYSQPAEVMAKLTQPVDIRETRDMSKDMQQDKPKEIEMTNSSTNNSDEDEGYESDEEYDEE